MATAGTIQRNFHKPEGRLLEVLYHRQAIDGDGDGVVIRPQRAILRSSSALVVLRREIATARTLGYAVVDGTVIPGMGALGMPIMGSDRKPLGSLAIAAISSRLAQPRREELLAKLSAEARAIEQLLWFGMLHGAETDRHVRDGSGIAARRPIGRGWRGGLCNSRAIVPTTMVAAPVLRDTKGARRGCFRHRDQ